jgi:hypothetical protein
MTKAAPDRIPGILAERVIVPAPWCVLIPHAGLRTCTPAFREANPFCVSGCSPPV